MVAARLTADCQDAHFLPKTVVFSAENEKSWKQRNTFSSENEIDWNQSKSSFSAAQTETKFSWSLAIIFNIK